MVLWKEMGLGIRSIACKMTCYCLWDLDWGLYPQYWMSCKWCFKSLVSPTLGDFGVPRPRWLKLLGITTLATSRLVQVASEGRLAQFTVCQAHSIPGSEHRQLHQHSWLLNQHSVYCLLGSATRTSSVARDRQSHTHHGQMVHSLQEGVVHFLNVQICIELSPLSGWSGVGSVGLEWAFWVRLLKVLSTWQSLTGVFICVTLLFYFDYGLL